MSPVVPLPASLHDDAVALWRDCGLTRPWNDPDADLQRAVRRPCSSVLAVVVEGQLLATVMVGHDGHRGWLYYLAVREDARGRGLGRALVQAGEAWVAERGIPKLQLMVRTGNEPALAFYERLGYEQSEVVVLGRRLDAGP